MRSCPNLRKITTITERVRRISPCTTKRSLAGSKPTNLDGKNQDFRHFSSADSSILYLPSWKNTVKKSANFCLEVCLAMKGVTPRFLLSIIHEFVRL